MNNKTNLIQDITIIISLFLAITSNTFSQNWNPINNGDIYNFKIDTSGIITNTIWVDSVAINGNDSIYYLNRIAHECDTCYVPYTYTYPIIDINYPQFLQKKVKFNDSGIYTFIDTSTLVINSLASVYESWLFDSTNNINATVSRFYTDTYFGITDSFKTILLSTGDTIILSKTFGIIQFPYHDNSNIYYRLQGIESRNLGLKVPNFWDIYNFNVGDVFQYHGGGGCPECYDDWTYKRTINSKTITDSGYIYNISYLFHHYGYVVPMDYMYVYFGDSTITFIDSINHSANKYNSELTKPCWSFSRIYTNVMSNDCFDSWEDHNSLYSKTFFKSGINNSIIKSRDEQIYTVYVDSSDYYGYYLTFNDYAMGLGVINSQFQSFENSGYEILEGYIKNGDTIGTITPDEIILSKKSIEQRIHSVNIFPNPAKDFIEIDFLDNNEIDSGTITITNINGSEISRQQFDSKKTKVNISDLNDGIYIIKVLSEQGITFKKLIIQK